MRAHLFLPFLALTVLALGCESYYYGEYPSIGDAPVATVEAAFNDNLFTGHAPQGSEGSLAVAGAFNPSAGQICLVYGILDDKPNEVPVYTAQVFMPNEANGRDFFSGRLYWSETGGGSFELFGEYEYHANANPKFFVVRPYALTETHSDDTGNDMTQHGFNPRPCTSLDINSLATPLTQTPTPEPEITREFSPTETHETLGIRQQAL